MRRIGKSKKKNLNNIKVEETIQEENELTQ